MSIKSSVEKCDKCNMPYVFKDVLRTSYTTIGIYECPLCGREIRK